MRLTLHEEERHEDAGGQDSAHCQPVGVVDPPIQAASLLLLLPQRVGVVVHAQIGRRAGLLVLLLAAI